MKETEVLTTLRKMLAILSSVATNADLPALAFLIGKAELQAAQAQANARQHQEIATLTASLKAQATLIQRVNAQLQLMKPEPQVVSNNN